MHSIKTRSCYHGAGETLLYPSVHVCLPSNILKCRFDQLCFLIISTLIIFIPAKCWPCGFTPTNPRCVKRKLPYMIDSECKQNCTRVYSETSSCATYENHVWRWDLFNTGCIHEESYFAVLYTFEFKICNRISQQQLTQKHLGF